MLQRVLIYIILLSLTCAYGGDIPFDRILTDEEVLNFLDQNNSELDAILADEQNGKKSKALVQLTHYLKEKISARYYFSWKKFNQRFKYYEQAFSDAIKKHARVADYQKSTFPAKTAWILPFKNLRNEEVTAYELRHLARQQKHNLLCPAK